MRKPLAVIAGLGALLGLLSGQLTAPATDPPSDAPVARAPQPSGSDLAAPGAHPGPAPSAPAEVAWTIVDVAPSGQRASEAAGDANAPAAQAAAGSDRAPAASAEAAARSPAASENAKSENAKSEHRADDSAAPQRPRAAVRDTVRQDERSEPRASAAPPPEREGYRASLPSTKDPAETGPPPAFESATQYRVTAAPGDTLSGLLTAAGLDRNAAQQAVAALRPYFNPRDLRAGQEVIIHFGQLSPVRTSSKHADDEAAIDQEEGAQGSVMDAITALLGDWRGRSAGRKDPAGQPERAEGKSGTDAPAALVEEPSADEPDDASDEDSREGLAVLGFTLRDGETREIYVVRTDDGFAAQEGKRKLERRILLAEGTIRTSFYVAATSSGVPPSVVANAIRALSFDVDFQREIQEGNRYQFLYDVLVDADSGALVRGGDLLFIGMALDSRVVRLYRHRPSGFPAGYFDAQGKSAKRALMRTPIDGARLTSGYGMRRHPVLGFSTMHRGIDFAAPVGTPVYAAGAGLIEKAGWFAAYGRYVRILHEGRFATAYAHLNRIPDHIQEGRRVRQGDVIGYVGASGRATGPHLHYEVLRDGAQVNPALMRMPTVAELSEQGLAAFHAERERIDAALESVAGPTLVSGRADGDGPARRVVMVRVGDL